MAQSRIILKPVIDLKKTGEKIKSLRKSNGFSVQEVKDIFGFDYPQAVYAWEQGRNVPTIDNLLVLSRLFKVPVEEIVAYTLVSMSCCCSEHAASCMNRDAATCEKCRFSKSA